MKYLRLVFSQLFAKKTRTILTLLSLIMAFLLFGLLQAVNVAFSSPAQSAAGATRLVVQSRVSFTQALPMRMLPELEAIKGVNRVYFQQWFGAYYQEPNNQLVGFAVEPMRLKDVYPEWTLSDAEWQQFERTRTGIIVGKTLANRFGWKVGDKIPLNSNIWPQQDGSKAWTFDIVGIFGGRDADAERRAGLIYINFAYFDEARQFGRGGAGIYVLRLNSANDTDAVKQAIDSRYENSPEETKTQTEQEFQLNFLKQLGDINLIVNAILGAVFFTILLLTGNTMAQAVRERIPQFAVLKTLGFTDGTVTWLVLAEAFILILLGALIGMAIAWAVGYTLSAVFGGSGSAVNFKVWGYAAISVVVLAIAVGLPPALRARRLKIVDALAGR